MNFNKLIEDVKRIQKETKKLYIYGAGFYGKVTIYMWTDF